MSRLVLSLVGAGIGHVLFPGSQFALSAGFSIGGFVDSLLFPKKVPDVVGPRINDLRIQSSAYGQPIPILFGTTRLPGNVTWSTGLIEKKKTQNIGGGKGSVSGKGGGTSTTFEYFSSWDSLICEGPASITRIWGDTKLIYDGTAVNQSPTGRFIGNIRIYTGAETDVADPIIEADKGTGLVPGGRGICHIVFDDFPLADFGNRIPNITAEVSRVATDAHPGRQIFSVCPGGEGGFVGDWRWNPQRTRLWQGHPGAFFNGGRDVCMVQHDPATLAVLRQSPIIFRPEQALPGTRVGGGAAAGTGYAVGADGDLYLLLTDPYIPFRYWVRKLDGNSFAEIYQVGPFSDSKSQLWEGNVVDPDGAITTVALYTNETDTIDVFAPSSGARVELVSGTDYNTDDGVLTASFKGPALDPQGNAWFVGADTTANQMRFLKIGPGGSTVEFNIDNAFDPRDAIFVPEINRILITTTFPLGGGQHQLNIYRFDPENSVIDGSIINAHQGASVSPGFSRMGTTLGKVGTTLWIGAGSGSMIEIDPAAMTKIRTVSGWSPVAGQTVYNDVNHSWLRGGGNEHFIDRQNRATESLRSVFEQLSQRVGFVAADYDYSAFDDEFFGDFTLPGWDDVLGYPLTGRAAMRRFAEELAAVYLVHVVESEWKLKGIRRQGNVTAATTLALADLGAYEWGSEPVPDFEETRRQEEELPNRIDLVYPDIGRDYQEGSQHSKRISEAVDTEDTVSVRTNVVFDATNAKQRTEIMLYQAWVARTGYNLALLPKFMELDPGDFIEFPIEGFNRRAFIAAIDYGASGLMQIQAILDDTETLLTDAVGAVADIPSNTGLLVPPPPTELFLMDVGLARDVDNNAGFYLAAGGSKGWRGTLVTRSTDGSTFSVFTAVLSAGEAVGGYAQTVLAAGTAPGVDKINSVDIRLFNSDFTLDSKTRLEVLNGANAAILGDEIIQWQTASLNSDGSFALSDLFRARRGTEHATGSHVAGERFVALDSSTVQRIAQDISEKGKERSYRASSIGEDPERAVTIRFTNNAVGLKPLSAVHITATRDSLDDIDIDWKRRSRIGKAYLQNVVLPIGEDTEAYEIDILDGVGDVVRTIKPLTTTFANYSASQQITDFGSVQSSVDIEIFQISAQVGRGFPGKATV